MAQSVFVIAPEREPTKEIKVYLFKVIVYSKDGWLGTLVRHGISQWLVEACKNNKVGIATYRWGNMPYLPDGTSREFDSDDDWACIRSIIDNFDVVVGFVDGKDHMVNAALVYAAQQGKETRNIPYKEEQ